MYKKGLAASAAVPLVLVVALLTVGALQITGVIDLKNINFGQLSPARNLTGNWEGRATWHDNIGAPVCFFEGTFRFNFQQTGNQLQGEWWLTQTKLTETVEGACGSFSAGENAMGGLSGSVGGSRVQFSALLSKTSFTASFTTDQIKGTFIHNVEFGIIGEFSAFRKS